MLACTNDVTFDGDYETISMTTGACSATGSAQPVIEDDHWFRLSDSDTLIAYFPCVALGECRSEHDLYRSFGRDGERWLTTIAIALAPGCTLRYRERTLAWRDGVIVIDDVAYEEIDPSLTGDACAITEARHRGTAMPCAEQIELVAEPR